jgi:imidazolonepropionase-like amidohydrolase
MHRAGVPILPGTDTPNPYCFPGFSLHDELQLLVEAGFSPLEALQSATRDAARFLGLEKLLGTIEMGKIADLVLLDANPLVEISNTKKIRAVISNGKLYNSDALEKILNDGRAAQR